jgi:hypothetical protein
MPLAINELKMDKNSFKEKQLLSSEFFAPNLD